MIRLLPPTFMLFTVQTLFLKKLKVSSNKYNWYRQFVYRFLCVFLNPIPLQIRCLEKYNEAAQYDFMLWSNFYIHAVKMPIYPKQ